MPDDKCFCGDHNLRGLKLDNNCKAVERLTERVNDLNDDLHGKAGLFTQVALLEQMMRNLKWPLVIITAAAVTQIVKTVLSAAPAVSQAIGG